MTDNGAIKNSIRNCMTVFMKDPLLQGAISYNLLTERVDIVKKLWWKKQTATLTDTDLNYLMLYLVHSAAHSGRWCGGPAAAVRFKQRPKLVSYIRFNHHGVVLCCTL